VLEGGDRFREKTTTRDSGKLERGSIEPMSGGKDLLTAGKDRQDKKQKGEK
jgi:hypothetical protein